MIYKSLDILPYKTFIKVIKTNDLTLLSSEPLTDEELEKIDFVSIWEDLHDDFQKLDENSEGLKILRLSKKVEEYLAKHKAIHTAVTCLLFEYNEELIAMLKNYGYKLTDATYHKDLERIQRESNAWILKAERLQSQLPEQKTDDVKETNVDEVILGYCSATQLQFDTNTISVTQFLAMQKVFKNKLKALEDNGK